jgi:chemotaxis protein CheZ
MTRNEAFMSVKPPRRPYTAEIIMARQQGKNYYSVATEADLDAGIPVQSNGVGDAGEILAAIAALREDLLEGGVKVSDASPVLVPEPEVDSSIIDNGELTEQLTDLSTAIAETKRELASMRDPNVKSAGEVKSATQELDAVVNATESATNDIMNAAELIDDLASRLKSQATSQSDASLAEEINEKVVNIFEACNFQDITGQRITKVVNTLAFIDERVSRMMEMWGAEQIEGQISSVNDDSDLLNGPAPEGEGSSQDDIDSLFD